MNLGEMARLFGVFLYKFVLRPSSFKLSDLSLNRMFFMAMSMTELTSELMDLMIRSH